MEKIFKRTLATIMVVLTVITSVPLSAFVGTVQTGLNLTASAVEEGLSSVATVDPTGYGVYDSNVVATKVTIGDDYRLASHNYEIGYAGKQNNYGEGYVLLRDKDYTTYYLVGTKGVIRSFYSDSGEEPKFTLLKEYSVDNPYALYEVYNPETEKYDLYNANTCKYYEYGLDSVYAYNSYNSYDYSKSVYEIKKDGKYGLVNNKGQILYQPIYEGIGDYENCFIGSFKDSDGYTRYAILSNKGTTSGTKLYDDYLIKDNILFAVSDIEPNETWETRDYMDWAMLNSDLTLMTDFIYSDVEIVKSNGIYYRVCSKQYEEIDYYGDIDYYYKHEVISDKGNVWDVCEKFNCTSSTAGIYNSTVEVCENGLKIYITDDYDYYWRNGTGWIDGNLKIPDFSYKYILAKPNGDTFFYFSATDETYREYSNRLNSVEGIYGKCEHRREYDTTTNKYINRLYDSKGNVISEISSSYLDVMGDYLVYHNSYAKKYFIYDYINEKMVLENIYIASVEPEGNGVCFAQSETSEKWAIFDTTTGKYTDYLVSANSLYVTETGFITNGKRILWICYGDDKYVYVNDKGVVLSTAQDDDDVGSLFKSGDYLIKNLKKEWNFRGSTYQVEIVDYDGKVKSSFDRKVYGDYENIDILYRTRNSENGSYGLAKQNGTTVIDNILGGVGNCYNGLVYVRKGDYASVVDASGNALMYGSFYIDDYEDAFCYVGRSGFASFQKGANIYIYDFTGCHNFDENEDASVVAEDHLFGEYNAFLDNGFYNSLTNAAGAQVATVLSHYGENAKAIARVKSLLDGQTGYVIEQLVDSLPGSSLNETKAKQEMALEYLNALDTETTTKYLKTLSTAKEIASKINEANKLDYDLNSAKSELQFVEIWTNGTGFYKSEIHKVIAEAKKHQDRFDAYFKATGRTIKLLEYVSSYLTIYLLQRDLVKSLMDMIPKNSDLYEGLNYIYLKQSKTGTVATLVAEMLTDEILGAVANLADEGLMKLAQIKNANVAALVFYLGGKIVSAAIDSAKLEDIDKTVLAYANMITLKTAINDYQQVISDNYSNGGVISVDTLKTEYSLLCDTYYKSIFTALKYAKKIALEDEKCLLETDINDFERKLIYRSYIKTCLLNARTQWEYTVKANKAIITKLKAEYPSGEGRVPYMELYENYSVGEKDEIAYHFEYAIDVPSTIDGYQVGAVGTESFSDNSKVTGVFVPDSVTEIQDSAFKNCSQINRVYLGSGIETIGNNAFQNCEDLGFVDIPDSVSEVGENAFSGIDSVVVTGSNQELLAGIAEDNITTQTRALLPVSLEIITLATKTQFNMQDEIDTSGLVLRVTYADGSTRDVTEGFYADVYNRVVGENIATLSFEGLSEEYTVNIVESQCGYTVSYMDEHGNEIAESETGTAVVGSTVELVIPEISGYIPLNETQKEVIGYRNNFVVKYREIPKVSLDEATITVEKQEFANKKLTPEVTVELDGKILVQDRDFLVSYSDNYYVGTASVIVLGTGDYEGILSANFVIFENEHTWSQWKIYYEPYGSSPGVKYRACDGCGKTEYKIYVNDNHIHSYTSKITKAATCTKTGTKTFTCSCGDTYTETVAKLGHKYSSSYTTDKKATCSAEGSKSKHCTRSGCTAKTSATAIAKLAHTNKTTTTKATLTKNGKVESKCSVCGYVSKTTTIYYPKTIKLSTTSYTYNGKAKTPSVTVKDGKGNTLKKDTDYTVSYASGRKNTGKYAVTVTFKGKYSGKKVLYFNILPSKTSKITPTCGTTSIKASWKKVTGASGYKVELLNSKGKVVKTVTTTKTAYTFEKLSKVTTYKIRVTAYKTIDSKKVYSTSYTTITTSTAPAKVTLSKVSAGSKSATPTWKKVRGASGYEVMYSTSSKFSSSKTATVNKGSSTKTTIKKLTKGKKYYFKVRAYKTFDGKKVYGVWSAVKSVKVK